MEKFENLYEIAQSLTVLYIEDEMLTRMIVEKKLKSLFKQVISAEDGTEGIEKFRQHNVDLVITDNIMPGISGLEVIKEIRKTDIKTPIILATAFIDNDILIDSINHGVTQFISKPITENNLLKAIEIAVQRVVFENLVQKARDQELQLLRYHEKYHSRQQEWAFRKELNIIRNDLFLRKIDLTVANGESQEWFVDAYFKPLDIMSGDSYSARELGEGKILLFLIDAMGKGLSASVTSILSTSFANYLVDKEKEHNSFEFGQFIDNYTTFIRREMLDEEIVCATFAYIDLKDQQMDTAIFSMPSIIGLTSDNQVIRIDSNNLPIMKFRQTNRIDRHDISLLKKILLHTDGLSESFKDSNSIYQEDLESDFILSEFATELSDRFLAKIAKPDDDVTFFFIKMIACKPKWSKHFIINSNLEEIEALSSTLGNILSSLGMAMDSAAMLISSATEILMNAHEHGNLGIDLNLKNKLIRNGTYEEYLLSMGEKTDKIITVSLSLREENGKEFLMLKIADQGPGFDISILKERLRTDLHKLNSRGIKISQGLVNGIYYNKKGNETTIIKQITGGNYGSNDNRSF